MSTTTRAALAALLALTAGPALAADHTNLEEGLPITIEDAYPIKENGLEVQSYFQYNRIRNDPRGASSLMAVPRLEWGAFKNFQLSVEAPYRVGTASDTDQGEFRAQGFYNFNQEGLVLPAMAVALGVNTPYGRMAGGTETELKFLATKSLGTPDPEGLSPYSYVPRQVHFNASWFHNYDPTTGREAERRDRYRVGVAYSQPISNSVVLVADVFVLAYPTTDVTGLDGQYEIQGIPVGKVKVTAYLPVLAKTVEKEIEIKEGNNDLDLMLSFDAKKDLKGPEPAPAPKASAKKASAPTAPRPPG